MVPCETFGEAGQAIPSTMKHAWLLKSLSSPKQRHVGSTTDLQARLQQHNQGKVSRTTKYLSWEIHVADGKCQICKKRWKPGGRELFERIEPQARVSWTAREKAVLGGLNLECCANGV